MKKSLPKLVIIAAAITLATGFGGCRDQSRAQPDSSTSQPASGQGSSTPSSTPGSPGSGTATTPPAGTATTPPDGTGNPKTPTPPPPTTGGNP